MTPLLPGIVEALDMPGHGGRADALYEWSAVWAQLLSDIGLVDWPNTTLVLHSFSAALIPEVVNSGIKPHKVVLIEGILFSEAGSWTERISQLSDVDFEIWLSGFRSVSKMALKSQLVSRPNDGLLSYWSDGFRIVSGKALQQHSINLCSRLNNGGLLRAVEATSFPVLYLLGDHSRLARAKRYLQSQTLFPVEQVASSGHFPMIDNPSDLAAFISGQPKI